MTTTATNVRRKHPLAECENCPLAQAPCVPSKKPTGRAKAAIVSRSPGQAEVRAGERDTIAAW